jgi:hypothetical protein
MADTEAEWIMPKNDDGMSDPIEYQVRCSNCGFDMDPQTYNEEFKRYQANKFCPKCGAKMKGCGLSNTEKFDNVNHPKHYCREGGMECLDEMLMLYGAQEVATWCKLNAHKYRYRASDKNGKEDIAKSDFYMKKYKELKGKLK